MPTGWRGHQSLESVPGGTIRPFVRVQIRYRVRSSGGVSGSSAKLGPSEVREQGVLLRWCAEELGANSTKTVRRTRTPQFLASFRNSDRNPPINICLLEGTNNLVPRRAKCGAACAG